MLKCIGMLFVCTYQILKHNKHKKFFDRLKHLREVCRNRFEACKCKRKGTC
jgi:hypothetical protein